MIKNDKQYYDDEDVYDPLILESHLKKQKKILAKYRDYLGKYFSGKKLNILELGAGTCGFTVLMSQIVSVERAVVLDISKKRMMQYAPLSQLILNSEFLNLTFIEGDFSEVESLPKNSFDLILFDASLHHARSIWDVLENCKSLLSERGMLIAQREQHVSAWNSRWKLSRLLLSPEVVAGVSENAYLRDQYKYYFCASGLNVSVIPGLETWLQKILSIFNGYLFSKWIYIAKKSQSSLGSELRLSDL